MAPSTFVRTKAGNSFHCPFVCPSITAADARRKSLWGSEIADNPPVVDYNEIMAPETSRVGVGKWTKKIVVRPLSKLISRMT
jgi:hypothetical protein